MMYTRYSVAAGLAAGKRVLELGCGAGQGFALMARRAKAVVGGDYSLYLLRSGQLHYRRRFPFVQLSADQLPFRDGAFDLTLCFEASYYVPRMDVAFREINRILAPGGIAVFVNANPERVDFIRSPHSVHYHTADGFRAALEELGFAVSVDGAFPIADASSGRSPWRARVLHTARRALEAFRLVPRTLRGRARLKRWIHEKLDAVPAELPEGFAQVAPRVPLVRGPVRGFKVLYVTARKTPKPPVGAG